MVRHIRQKVPDDSHSAMPRGHATDPASLCSSDGRSVSCPRRSTSKAWPTSGTTRTSPVFVCSGRSIITCRSKSTRSHVRPTTSPLRIAVLNATTTTGYRCGFLLSRHAARSRTRSESERHRARPRGSLGRDTLRIGLWSSQPHSLVAMVKQWLSAAMYRTTVLGEGGSPCVGYGVTVSFKGHSRHRWRKRAGRPLHARVRALHYYILR